MALTERQLETLRTKVLTRLTEAALPQVLESETEPTYTGRAILPALEEMIRELNHPGLKLRGDGLERPDYVTLGHLKFTPDVAISHDHSREIAVECKFISARSVNNPVSTGIGQATLYRNLGYRLSMLILVESKPTRVLQQRTTESLMELASSLDIDVIVARTLRTR